MTASTWFSPWRKGTDAKFRVLYRPLAERDSTPVHLVGEFDAEYSFIDNDGPIFWFKTNKNAARGKVVAIDTRSPQPEHWREIVPEAAETLGHVDVIADHFLAVLPERRRHRRSSLRPARQACSRRVSAGPGNRRGF